ncbi:hypothetical protein SAMN05216579_2850 [Pseudomonas granadensis]|nr:hypothetical protein SAMN05216579_2850 [Pseudomonas granadensis]
MVDVRDAPTCDIELNATFENQQPLTLTLSRRERGLTVVDVRDAPTCDIELNATFENQQPLTLALSRRERGLIVVIGRHTPTCDTESYAIFEANADRLPLPPGEGWGEGRIH